MKPLVVLVAVFLLATIIDAAPKTSRTARKSPTNPTVAHREPRQGKGTRSINPAGRGQPNKGGKTKRQFPIIFQGGSVYPNYYIQQSSPLIDFQNSFLRAAFFSGAHYTELEKYLKKQNLTDSNGKPLPLDAKTALAFEASFGDKKGDVKGASDLKARIVALEGLGNINIVNPFLVAKGADGKPLKLDGSLPAFKAGKLGDANNSIVALISPFQGGRLDAVFGPEIAPRYEIHYSPQGISLDPLPPFTRTAAINSAVGLTPIGPAAINVAPIEPAFFGPIGPLSAFGIAPNALFAPYPYPFIPGFNPKNLKPNGKDNNGKKPDSYDQPAETTSESYPETTPAASASETTSEASATEPSQ